MIDSTDRPTTIERWTRVFVYGTLMEGLYNSDCLGRAARKIATHVRLPGYRLRDLGSFPGMVEAPGDRIAGVYGEVWEVLDGAIADMDRLEGHPTFYRRVGVVVPGVGAAQTYLYVAEWGQDKPLVPCGDWRTLEEGRGRFATIADDDDDGAWANWDDDEIVAMAEAAVADLDDAEIAELASEAPVDLGVS